MLNDVCGEFADDQLDVADQLRDAMIDKMPADKSAGTSSADDLILELGLV